MATKENSLKKIYRSEFLQSSFIFVIYLLKEVYGKIMSEIHFVGKTRLPTQPEVGGGRYMLDKKSLYPQLAGARRGFKVVRDQSYKRIMKYCFIHLQCLQGKEI